MDDEGQISLEYLLLILVAILILGSVTIPLIGKAIDASNDVSRASDAKIAVETIANAVDIVYANGPGAKRTITFYIPQDGRIGFDNQVIYFDVTLSNGTTRRINATTEYANIAFNPVNLNRGWHKAVIRWPDKSVNIVITVS